MADHAHTENPATVDAGFSLVRNHELFATLATPHQPSNHRSEDRRNGRRERDDCFDCLDFHLAYSFQDFFS